MSPVTLHCPECNADLLVPETAAGRRARCSKCQARFVIPNAQELLELQIAQMATDELGDRWNEGESDNAPLATAAASPPRRPETVSADAPATGDTIMGIPAPPASPPSRLGQTPATERPDTPTPSDPAGVPGEYPDDPCRPPARPYLVVREVDTHGVLFVFEARWLNDRRFQVSIPKRCVHSGDTKKLNARPVIAKNRTHDTTARARAIEMHYEQDVGPKYSPFALIDSIARIEGVKQPFDRPLLYYTSEGHTNDALKCTGSRTDNGTDLAEVQIPHGEVALKWLERINGFCDPACEQLKADIDNLGSNAWLAVPERIRQRLEAWCRFERGEKFLIYLRDADMTSADAGLGGIAVTDRRLLYNKYRQSLSTSLNQEATLHVRTDDRVARLTLEAQGRMTKAGKIARGDVNALVEALSDAPRLRVMVGKK